MDRWEGGDAALSHSPQRFLEDLHARPTHLRLRHGAHQQMVPEHRFAHYIPFTTPHLADRLHNMGRAGPRAGCAYWRHNYELVQPEAVTVFLSARRIPLTCRTLKRGQQRLLVHRGVEADPKPDTTTPSEVADGTTVDEMGRLEAVSY